VSIIQGNIDQSIKWNPAYQEKTITLYEKLTRATYRFKPHLIVWPETSVPFFFQNATRFSNKVLEISKESKAFHNFNSFKHAIECTVSISKQNEGRIKSLAK